MVSTYYDNKVVQCFYGVVVILISIVNIVLNKVLNRANKGNKDLSKITKKYMEALIVDVDIKILGFAIAISIFPQAMMISVFLSAIFMIIRKK